MPPTQITTADGHVLDADLAEPDGPVRGAVVVCHPHPLYGGNRGKVFWKLIGYRFRSGPRRTATLDPFDEERVARVRAMGRLYREAK